MKRAMRVVAALAVVSLIAAGCGDDDDNSAKAGSSNSSNTTVAGNKATGEPIKVGYVNLTQDPVTGGLPDGLDGIRAAVRLINEKLGGVKNRPIDLFDCNVTTAPESGTACAAKLVEGNPVVVINGYDSVADNYMTALRNAGIPYVTKTPTGTSQFTSPNSFLLAGGAVSIGPAAAMFALNDLKAKRVAVIYADSPQAQVIGDTYIKRPLAKHNVEVDLIPVPVVAPDMAPVISAALSKHPDLVYGLVGEAHCIGAFKALASNPTKVPIMFQGGCSIDKVIHSAGDAGAEGVYFVVSPGSVEDPGNPDFEQYVAAMKQYAPKTSLLGVAPNSFATMMTVYAVLKSIDGDITKESVTAAFKGAKAFPQFFGGTFTCDGKQFPNLPEICSTISQIAQYKDGKLKKVKTYESVLPLFE